ncbi:MAG: hypothetical protein H6582_02245 [Crocinitomicaceae bacterium]|nr:hypothetical protein [Crocinitomicaceae bacterium]
MYTLLLGFLMYFPVVSIFNGGVDLPEKKIEEIKIDQQKFVDRHNYYRDKVNVPKVEWSDEIALYAQEWANQLALSCQLKHRSGNDGYGENICMAPISYDEEKVVDIWASEEAKFNHNDPVFRHKDLYKYGHYSQLIWRKTERIGAGAAKCSHGSTIWVCNYDPPGNYIDQRVY